MKKLILFALIAVSMVSCLDVIYGPQQYSILYITKITETNTATGKQTATTIEYGTFDSPGPIKGTVFEGIPVVRRCQDILSEINVYEYSYKGENLIQKKSTDGKLVSNDTLLLDDNNMVVQVMKNGTPTPLTFIKYNSLGYRTEFNGSPFTISNNNYVMTLIGDVKLEYFYSSKTNDINIQQAAIGGDFSWFTGHYGKQSKYLLDHVIETNTTNNTTVRYDYSYLFDALGLVRKETVKIENSIIYTTEYEYAKFAVLIPQK